MISMGRKKATTTIQYVTFRVEDQWFGIPVAIAQEVIVAQNIALVPLAPAEIAGFLNLRGQIVTAMDLRRRLGLTPNALDQSINIVVRLEGELFSLLVDEVGDVVTIESDELEPLPQSMSQLWREVCSGIIRQPNGLLLVVHVNKLLRIESAIAA